MNLKIENARFNDVAQPVIFESEYPEFRYWIHGSSVLLSTAEHCYWVTAAHVMEKSGAAPGALRIFPADDSTRSLPFDEQYEIQKTFMGDDDFKDLFVLRVNLGRFMSHGDGALVALDVNRHLIGADSLSGSSPLRLVGYPSANNSVDYEERSTLNTARTVLCARYLGPGPSDHCHIAELDNAASLSSLDGLSGGPVFSIGSRDAGGSEEPGPVMVGLMLRGTAESGRVHFLSASVISRMIRLLE